MAHRKLVAFGGRNSVRDRKRTTRWTRLFGARVAVSSIACPVTVRDGSASNPWGTGTQFDQESRAAGD